MTDKTLVLLPDRRAESDPEGVCIDDDSNALSNAEFAQRVQAAAELFADGGVARGGVVASMLSNRVELIVAMFAAWRLGAALTPINPSLTAAEALYQIEDSKAVALVHEGSALEAPVVMIDAKDLPRDPAGGCTAIAPLESDTALLIYTSGTTGRPKGVVLDHGNVASMVAMIRAALELRSSDHSLVILPLFHVNGLLVSVLSPLAAGGSASVTGRFSASAFFDTVEALRPTFFSAVPSIYSLLTSLPDDIAPDTSSLRFAVCGAAPMPPNLISRFEERFGVTIIEGYGLSEASCACTINPLRGPRKPGTVGLPLPGQEISLWGRDGTVLATGPGEVVVRGPNVMRGYLNRPEETAEAFAGGWLHTGDIGVFDEDGYLMIVDRVKEMIIRGGENIYPKEIENVLYSHPDVLEAAVVGREHEILGEEPLAFVALRPGAAATADDLRSHCSRSLARYKVPSAVSVLEMLPKNPVGKIDKRSLRESSQ